VSLVAGDATAKPIHLALSKLSQALQQKGVRLEDASLLQNATGETVVVAGLTSVPSEAAKFISELRLTSDTEPESLLIRRFNREGLYCREEADKSKAAKGTVALLEATPAGLKETGRFDPPGRSDKNSWSHPVIAGGKLFLRDQEVPLCYDVKAK